MKLQTGQRLLLYTDGLVEARDASGRMFELQEQVTLLRDFPSLDGALEDLLKRLDAHAHPALTDDDVALVLCEATGDTPP